TSQVYEPKGYEFAYVPADEFDANLAAHLDERTKLVWAETPSNPLLNLIDIRRAADAAHAAGALLVVDNTFASPYLQRPLERGAADAGLRRDDLLPRRVGGGGRRARRADEAVPARRVARQRREPDRASCADDARVDGRCALRRAAQPRPALGRDRVGRGSDRR